MSTARQPSGLHDHEEAFEARCNTCRHNDWSRGGAGRAAFLAALTVDREGIWVLKQRKISAGVTRGELDVSVRKDAAISGREPERWELSPRVMRWGGGRADLETLRLRCPRGHKPQVRPERLKKLLDQARRRGDNIVWL